MAMVEFGGGGGKFSGREDFWVLEWREEKKEVVGELREKAA